MRASGMRSDIVCSRIHTVCLPRHSQHGGVVRSKDCANWTPARLFKQATGLESFGDKCGTLEDDRCIDTGVFPKRCLLHELVFACSQAPPQQPQISYNILAQADWCAVRTVARCELGLLPVVNALEAGRFSCFCQGSKFFSIIRTGVQNSMEKEELEGRHFPRPQSNRSWGATPDAPWAKEVNNEEIAADALPFQLRFPVAGTYFHPSPLPAPETPFWEFLVQSRLALLKRHCTARALHFADLGGCHLFEMLQQRAEQLRGALHGAPVPDGSNLRRPNGEGGHACGLIRHAFASVGLSQPFVSRQQVVHVLVLISGPDVMVKGKEAGQQMPGCRSATLAA